MHTFGYQRATSLADAVAVLKAKPDARPLAGGMTLLPTMKLGLAAPSDLIDLSAIGDLRGIRRNGDRVVIGAMTRHAEVAASAEVRAAIPALASLADGIGDAQVRNRGTLGGSVANSDPAADYPAAVLGLDANVLTDRRTIAADQFFLGMFATALDAGELIRAVEFRVPKRAGYAKFPNPASRYAMVGVLVADYGGSVRVAVTGAGACAFRVPTLEAALGKQFSAAAIEGIEVSASELNTDLHGSAEYRAHLVGVMARRAVAAALG